MAGHGLAWLGRAGHGMEHESESLVEISAAGKGGSNAALFFGEIAEISRLRTKAAEITAFTGDVGGILQNCV